MKEFFNTQRTPHLTLSLCEGRGTSEHYLLKSIQTYFRVMNSIKQHQIMLSTRVPQSYQHSKMLRKRIKRNLKFYYGIHCAIAVRAISNSNDNHLLIVILLIVYVKKLIVGIDGDAHWIQRKIGLHPRADGDTSLLHC